MFPSKLKGEQSWTGRMVKIFLPFFHTIFQFHFSFSLFFQLYLSHLLREIIDIDRDTWNSRELIFKDMCICIYIYRRRKIFIASDEFYSPVGLFHRVANTRRRYALVNFALAKERATKKSCYKVDCSINRLYIA